MESEHVVCVICNRENDEKTAKFTATSLDKRKSILKIRKEHNFKYRDVILPNEVNSNKGYHVKCYSKFLAVMKKYRESELSAKSDLPSSPSGKIFI